MPAIPTSTGIVLFPALINWLLASLPITLFAVGFYVWRHALHESSPLVLAALIGLDHLIAFMIARPLLAHFLAANFSSSRATSGDLATDASIHAVRATSAVGIALAVDTILVQLLGRTILLAIGAIFLLLHLQAGAWGAVLALRLQQSGGLECLPTSWQRLLSATPLEILSTFKARPPSRFPVSAGEVIGLARALAPLILLPDEHRDDALALLPPNLAEALDQPTLSLLPAKAKAMLAPWEESAGLRISGVGDAAAVAEDEGNDTAPGPSPAATAPAPADDEFTLTRRDSEPALDTYTPFSGLPPSVAESAPVTANNSPRLNGINPRLTGGANGHRSAAAPVSTRQTKAALAPEILITKMVAKGAARIVTRQVGSAKEQVVGLATAAKKTTYDTIVAGPALIAGWAINMGWGVLKSLASPFLPPGNKGAPVDAAALGAAVAEVAAAVAEGETSDDEPTLRRRNVARA